MAPNLSLHDPALIGVAGASSCQTTASWDEEATSSMSALYAANDRTIQGGCITTGSNFILQNLKTATFYIEKTGSPTGSITSRLYPSAVHGASLGTFIEESDSLSIDGTGDYEFTFSGDNDIALNNALVIACTFTSSSSSDYINLVAKNYSPDPTESSRQYQKETGSGASDTVWEAQDNRNPRFKVCS